MADQALFKERLGTPIVFGVTSSTTVAGMTVTNNLGLDALASGSGRMGVEADLGADFPAELLCIPVAETGTAPTAGGTVDYYLAGSHDGTNYPAGVTGADAAWPGDGNEDEWALQLGVKMSLVATNDGNTVQVHQGYRIPTPGRYIAPVCDNNLSQALRDETTASDNGSGLIVYPIIRVAVDP